MSGDPKEKLLLAIREGRHDGKQVPHHVKAFFRRNENGTTLTNLVEVVDPAASSMDLAILRLAIGGEVSPTKLIQIYPDQKLLRRHLIETEEAFRKVEPSFADGINDLIVLKMIAVGWDT